MNEQFKTVFETFTAEIVEKKSRFICTLAPAETEEEALELVKQCRKTHYSARHHCSAYIIGNDGRIKHSSDDGEPSGTAGKPMLSILEANNLRNVAAVVTRYFGGVLLGTGGLVRAYSGALEACIASAKLTTMLCGAKIKIEASYTDVGKLQYMFANENVTVLSSDYTDKVCFYVIVPENDEASFIKKISEATASKAVVEVLEHSFYRL